MENIKKFEESVYQKVDKIIEEIFERLRIEREEIIQKIIG